MAYYEKTPAGTWRCYINVKGKRLTKTFKTKARAEVWGKTTEGEMLDSPVNFELKVFNFEDLCEKYIRDVTPTKRSARDEELRIKGFARHPLFVGKRVTEVTKDVIEAYVDERSKEIAPASVIRSLVVLQSIFTHAIKWELCYTNPVKGIDNKPAKPKARDRLVTDKELQTFVKACKYKMGDKPTTMTHRLALAALFASETAMRSGEILALKKADIKGNVATLHTSKTGEGREVPLSSTAREIIRLLPTDDLFDMKDSSRDALFRKIRDSVGMDWTFHDLRHKSITRMARIPGMDVMTLARITGHSSPDQLLEYFNPRMSKVADLLG